MAHDNYHIVQPGQVGQVLGPGGAAGDVLERLEISVTDAAACEVSIKDGGGSAITVLPQPLGAGLGAYSIPFGAPSKAGPWSITAGLGSTVKAVGSFSRKNQADRLSLPGTAGNYASTPDSAAVSITGDIDIRVKLAANDWSSAQQTVIGIWNANASDISYMLSLAGAGTLLVNLSADGASNNFAFSTAAVSFADGAIGWIRMTWRASDGRIQFFTSSDGITWTQLGTDITRAIGSLFDGAGALRIGAYANADADFLTGKVYYAEIRNGIDGEVVAKFDPREGDIAATTFTSGTGEVWTINQSGSPAAVLD